MQIETDLRFALRRLACLAWLGLDEPLPMSKAVQAFAVVWRGFFVPRHSLPGTLPEDACGQVAAANLPCTFFLPACLQLAMFFPACCWPCSLLFFLLVRGTLLVLSISSLPTCCSQTWTAGCRRCTRQRRFRRAPDTACHVRPFFSKWEPTGQHRTRRQAQAGSVGFDRVSWSAPLLPCRPGFRADQGQLSWSFGCCASSSAPASGVRCTSCRSLGGS